MTLEERKDNTYFDQSGKQILEGDLLKVFHFRSRNRNYYMYQVAVLDISGEFPVMSMKAHYADTAHYRLYTVCDNAQRVYFDAKIISQKGLVKKRKKIKVIN